MSALLRDINESYRSSVSLLPKGMNFARAARILAHSKNRMEAIQIAEATWGERSAPAAILKAAVAPATTTDTNWLGVLSDTRIAAAEFVEVLRPLTILGRMSGYRRAPMQIKIPRMASGAVVGWAGEAKPTAVTSVTIDTIELDNFKIAGIVVSTNELIRLSSPSADGLVRADLLAAVAAWQDRALLDPAAAAVAGVSPASITNGAVQIASTGATAANAVADLKLMFAELTSNGIPLTSPYFLMAPGTAAALGLMLSGTNFAFPGVGALGGSIAGVPVLVSGSVLSTVIVLVDAAELIVCDTDEISLDMGQHASIQLNTTPDNPATAATVMTSLFQQNLAAWRVVRAINWTMRRPHAVVTLTGVAY